jgi:hypothetical protein
MIQVIITVVVFAVGGLIGFVTCKRGYKMEQMADADYMAAVRLIVTGYSKEQALVLLDELNDYMSDLTATGEDLTSELEYILRTVNKDLI